MFRHPNYYKNLRKLARNRDSHVRPISGCADSDTDQAISPMSDGSPRRRATGPGLKQQASSIKQQASSQDKPEPVQVQTASSAKRQASQSE